MIYVIANNYVEACSFMNDYDVDEEEWVYLTHCGAILNQESLRVVLVDGWQNRVDAGMIRILLEHKQQVTVLCSPTPTETESEN
jgi:hypothetical protein